jgi:hypothetical protein
LIMTISPLSGISKPNGITGTLTGISNAGGISSQAGAGPTPPPPYTFATWSETDKSADLTVSGGGYIVSKPSNTGWVSVRATIGKAAGKWYYEVSGASALYSSIGAVDAAVATGTFSSTIIGAAGVSASISSHGYDNYDATNVANGVTFGPSDIIGVKMNLDDDEIIMLVNNVVVFTYSCAGRGTDAMVPGISLYADGNELTANFGQAAFTYEPAGYNLGVYDE